MRYATYQLLRPRCYHDIFSPKKSQAIHLRNTANSCAAAVQTLLVLESPVPKKMAMATV